ncbi:hypothetical protein ACCAA_260022 [Candidatus Accumulibacter aalborgensis]|uniref:Uncharacterized protein n=1 Tax=Candidatus Accumulibacter aalborgensis TaxID=1860102 RepID=A0A1A8XMK5_9PROT|nr:hypothetical protein ACCAA_260022 [Candidatus Accumulibacter aalborgensis]
MFICRARPVLSNGDRGKECQCHWSDSMVHGLRHLSGWDETGYMGHGYQEPSCDTSGIR